MIALVALASASAYLTRHCIAVANTTIQEELAFTDEQMGWILGAFSAGYFFFQVPGGWLGNRYGTRWTLPTISVLWSMCTVWTAAVGSFVPMFASRVAFGTAQAGLVPNSAKIIREWLPVQRHGLGSALVGAAMSIGAVVTMQKLLKAPITFLGLSLPEHGYHAPNEFYDWGQASGGVKMFARYFEEISRLAR